MSAETGPEACERLDLPYGEQNDPALYAMARTIAESIGYSWDAMPFHDLNADGPDQTYYLLLAKNNRERLREWGFDVVRSSDNESEKP